MEKSFLGRNDLPKGLRNNNPGNLRPSDNWKGMIGVSGDFIQFKSIEWGIRALGTDLSNKFLFGLDTIIEIISRYAPPSENNTPAYINAVSAQTGFSPDEKLVWSRDTLFKMIRAIIDHENGSIAKTLITSDDINNGIKLMSQSLLDKLKDFFLHTPKLKRR